MEGEEAASAAEEPHLPAPQPHGVARCEHFTPGEV